MFTTNTTALRQALEQVLQASDFTEVEDLDFLTISWNPNSYPDSRQIGALLRAVQQIGLIQGEGDQQISYIEEDFEGEGSYAFFVDRAREYDSLRILSTFGQTGRVVPDGVVGVEAAIEVVEQAIERSNAALAHLRPQQDRQGLLSSTLSPEEIEKVLASAVTMYRGWVSGESADYLDYPDNLLLERLSALAGEPKFSFEVSYRLLRQGEPIGSSYVPILAVDEDQAAQRGREWITQNDTRYREGDVIEITETEET